MVSAGRAVRQVSMTAPGPHSSSFGKASDRDRNIHAAEGASDPLMYSTPERLLWAPRQGKIICQLPKLPRFDVIAGLQGEATRTDPHDLNFADISDLVPLWISACEIGDLPELGRLASQSAQRNLALRGGPPLQPLLEIGQRNGAVGIAIAHTGSARALLFTPGAGDKNKAELDIRQIGLKSIRRFTLGD